MVLMQSFVLSGFMYIKIQCNAPLYIAFPDHPTICRCFIRGLAPSFAPPSFSLKVGPSASGLIKNLLAENVTPLVSDSIKDLIHRRRAPLVSGYKVLDSPKV